MVFIRRTSKLLLAVPLLACIVLILYLAGQTYAQQTIKPLLGSIAPKEVMAEHLPKVTIHYDGAVIVAKEEPYRFLEFLCRKTAHVGIYALLALTAALALSSVPVIKRRRGLAPAVVAILVLFIASADEMRQRAAALRTPAWQDVVIDLCGAGLGLLIYAGLKRIGTRQRKDGL